MTKKLKIRSILSTIDSFFIVKFASIVMLVFPVFPINGQADLTKIDLTIDFHDRFYQGGKLSVPNSILYIDSVDTLTISQVHSINGKDTNKYEKVKHGAWIEYFDKKWAPCSQANFTFYRLVQYDQDAPTGKIYYFNSKGNLTEMVLRYPAINDSIFEGVQRITYRKGKVKFVQYQRFIEDSLKGFYFNLTSFYPNGTVESYSYSDDYSYCYQTLEFDKSGLCTYELSMNKSESYRIKRKRKGKKEILWFKENGNLVKIIRIDGQEKRRKQCL